MKNIDKMVEDHIKMKNWHDGMAKSAASMMEDHIKAAAWHDSQIDLVKAMMNEVPLDPEKKVTSVPTGGSTPTPTSGSGYTSPSKEVPLDPDTVKKSDLTSILNDYVKEHGSFDMDVDTIVNFLMAD